MDAVKFIMEPINIIKDIGLIIDIKWAIINDINHLILNEKPFLYFREIFVYLYSLLLSNNFNEAGNMIIYAYNIPVITTEV